MKKVRFVTAAAATIPAAATAAIGIPQLPASAAVRPAYTQEPCNGVATQNWVHLDATYHGSVCVGGKGRDPVRLYVKSFCPGNNKGWFSGTYKGGFNPGPLPFSPGSGWRMLNSPLFLMSNLSITGWTGSHPC